MRKTIWESATWRFWYRRAFRHRPQLSHLHALLFFGGGNSAILQPVVVLRGARTAGVFERDSTWRPLPLNGQSQRTSGTPDFSRTERRSRRDFWHFFVVLETTPFSLPKDVRRHLFTCIYHFIHIFRCFYEPKTFVKLFVHMSKGMFSQEIRRIWINRTLIFSFRAKLSLYTCVWG